MPKPWCQRKLSVKCDLRNLSSEELKDLKSKCVASNPFQEFLIKDPSFLNEVHSRFSCKKCGKSRKYFCYSCYIPCLQFENDIPKVKLPCFIDIIKHPKEIDGKSTAVHARILAPNEVQIYTYPDIPEYSKGKNVYMVFPGNNSIPLETFHFDISSQSPTRSDFKKDVSCHRIIFLDATWNQTAKLLQHNSLKDLPRLQLTSRKTLFWRYQTGKPDTYLATIEAIYYFVRDFHLKFIDEKYSGEYDNLLFFFKYMYQKIHALYGSSNLLAYKDGS